MKTISFDLDAGHHRSPRSCCRDAVNYRAAGLYVLALGFALSSVSASAVSTQVSWSSNIDPRNGGLEQNVLDPEGEVVKAFENQGGYITGSRGFAGPGVVKAYATADTAENAFALVPVRATTRSVVRDSLVVDTEPSFDGQSGWLDFRVSYNWSLLTPEWGSAAATIFATIGGSTAVASEWIEVDPTYRESGVTIGRTRREFVPLQISGAGIAVGAIGGKVFQARLPVVFGRETGMILSLGVTALAYKGLAEVDAANSAYWGGVTVLDENFEPIVASVVAASGTDYTRSFAPPIPEPSSAAQMFLGLIALLGLGAAKLWRNEGDSGP